MRFRPCIDLHQGKVKQIVGGTLRDEDPAHVKENFVSPRSAADFARMYKEDGLPGGHVIMLGPGNEEEALSALKAFPGGLQVGGGITPDNADRFLEAGASHVIVTSYVFHDGIVDEKRLDELVASAGKERLVLDLSCREKDDAFTIVTNRWQSFTQVQLDAASIASLQAYCSEFLVHAADVEGRMEGIHEGLVASLAQWCTIPTTYAGGATSLEDLDKVKSLGQNRIDLTIGSALDLFGGSVPYKEVVRWHHAQLG